MLTRFLEAKAAAAYALMRIVSGLMFSFHGMQKILGILSDHQPVVGSQLWFGGMIELVAGLLVAVGAFTPFAAFLASGTMAVAYTQFHWKLELGQQLLPAMNKGELALLYAVVFLVIACNGAGVWSLDHLRTGKARETAVQRPTT
jgi:putative oxidoreductase